MPKLRLVALLLISFAVLSVHAQENGASQSPTLRIPKIADSRVKVDGHLDEAVWQKVTPIKRFIQTEPDQGEPVSERTEALIFYDDENIYFGFRCYDSEPQKVTHRLGAHDASTGSDSMDILLDTFGDRRTGYFFSINSRGIQFDALMNDNGSGGFDETWDGIWYSRGVMQDWGWSAEVVIPFKSLRISRASDQTWGLNIARDIPRKNERASWAEVTRFDGMMRPSKAGTITGIQDVRVGRNLEVIPFVSSAFRKADWAHGADGYKGNTGVDARYGLTQNLTANVTVNPDFADTEADEFNTTLSRFEIFFPEKRKFFTEGANYFQTPMNLVFTRRIGAPLPDGEPQRILEGGKLTGKIDKWTIGMAETMTQGTSYVDPYGVRGYAPGAFFGVLRLKRDIFQKSSIGFMTVNRVQDAGDVGANESTHAIDLSILHGEHLSWVSQFLVNVNETFPGFDSQHLGWQSELHYNSELWEYGAEGKFLGRHVDMSHTGYEPETDRLGGDAYVTYKPFINRWGMRQLFFNINYDESNGTRGELQDAGADADFQVVFKNFWKFHARHSYDRVRFNLFSTDPDTGNFIPLDPTKVYTNPRYALELYTNENRRYYFTFKFLTGKLTQFEEFFHGSEKRVDVGMSARIGDHARLEMTGVNSRESLLNGRVYQDRQFVISRLNYQFTPKLRARTLAQYEANKHGHNLSVNSLMAYDFTARSALFVGYNRQRRSPWDLGDLGNQFFVKLSYLFAF